MFMQLWEPPVLRDLAAELTIRFLLCDALTLGTALTYIFMLHKRIAALEKKLESRN